MNIKSWTLNTQCTPQKNTVIRTALMLLVCGVALGFTLNTPGYPCSQILSPPAHLRDLPQLVRPALSHPIEPDSASRCWWIASRQPHMHALVSSIHFSLEIGFLSYLWPNLIYDLLHILA